jgi:hypothetical protein
VLQTWFIFGPAAVFHGIACCARPGEEQSDGTGGAPFIVPIAAQHFQIQSIFNGGTFAGSLFSLRENLTCTRIFLC